MVWGINGIGFYFKIIVLVDNSVEKLYIQVGMSGLVC